MVYSLPKSDNTYTTHASTKQSTGIIPHTNTSLSDCIYVSNPVKDEIIINVTEGTNAEEYILYDIKGIAVKNALLIKTSDGVVNKRIIKQ